MLEITGDHIAELNDEDLRSLIGMLCESELHSRGIPTSAVTWGGSHTAVDGGIDVRVEIVDGKPPGGFVPRNNVGFQVKKTNFTPKLIPPEMRPSNQLRDSIRELIDVRGAYIIVSSGSSTSDAALRSRKNAMRSAVLDQADHGELQVDFYDRNRIATWTRIHPGMGIWVREKIGRGIPGWKPYGSWASSSEGVEVEYLLDSRARLHIGTNDQNGIGLSLGIDRIRDALREPRSTVRLIGLSGVGKTRLVQALFDSRIGSNSLNPGLAIYTDMSDNPSPQPAGMISDLIALKLNAIVVVDNCAPDLHRRVAEICRSSDSCIGAITIEYDVQDDEPEGTEVFRLDTSSIELIAKLTARRYPSMADQDVQRIADFSGGNARIAFALANTVERYGSVAGLRDEELFRRLFHQRQQPDESLLKAAQACSLLYSFQGEAIGGVEAELPKIATLLNITAPELFDKVAVIHGRELIQKRGVWRAILPQAIANRLAAMALRQIPREAIEGQFNTNRLLRSFTRRLAYLHESEDARGIVESWLAEGGMLSEIDRLSELGLMMLDNIAPVSPEATLGAVERALSGVGAKQLIDESRRREKIGSILYSIAYDASLFSRCVAAMLPLLEAERAVERLRPIENAIETLFHHSLSGTHATIEQRSAIVEDLLNSPISERRVLGGQLLGALLETDRFSSTQSHEFGARVRDYGYSPSTIEEGSLWFATALQLARRFASTKDGVDSTIRSSVARSISGLWFLGIEVQEQLEAVATEISITRYWQEGWFAVRSLLSSLPDKEKNSAMGERLLEFERRLRPNSVADQVRAIVLSSNRGTIDYAESEDVSDSVKLNAAYQKSMVAAEGLGKTVCGDQALFSALLPELVSVDGARLVWFGRGMALASTDHRGLWSQFSNALAETERAKRNVQVLCGFLNGLWTIDQPQCETILEEAVTHPIIGEWLPDLERQVPRTSSGTRRLKHAAKLGISPSAAFRYIPWEPITDAASALDLREFLMALATQKHGYHAAICILAEHFQSGQDAERKHSSELIDIGRELLSAPDFASCDNMHDYHLKVVADACLEGAGGVPCTKALCERFKQGVKERELYAYNFDEMLESIFKLQSRTALNVFFQEDSQSGDRDLDSVGFYRFPHHTKRPLEVIAIEDLLQWCDEKPESRYEAIARIVSFEHSSDLGCAWTPLAIEMLSRAPDALAVLKTFINRFRPSGGSGSVAATLESRLGLLDRLGEVKNNSLKEYAVTIRPLLLKNVAKERKSERDHDREHYERFE